MLALRRLKADLLKYLFFYSMENKRKQKDKREVVYIAAVSLYDSKEYYKALNKFNTISGYKDSDDYINKCQYCLNEESYERGKTEFDNARYYNAYTKVEDGHSADVSISTRGDISIQEA